jgi:hypothetical protein
VPGERVANPRPALRAYTTGEGCWSKSLTQMSTPEAASYSHIYLRRAGQLVSKNPSARYCGYGCPAELGQQTKLGCVQAPPPRYRHVLLPPTCSAALRASSWRSALRIDVNEIVTPLS